jgi:hypothetical protein
LVELGAWSLELGAWSLELGAWSLELGAWSLELGAWSLELGAWSPDLITIYDPFSIFNLNFRFHKSFLSSPPGQSMSCKKKE